MLGALAFGCLGLGRKPQAKVLWAEILQIWLVEVQLLLSPRLGPLLHCPKAHLHLWMDRDTKAHGPSATPARLEGVAARDIHWISVMSGGRLAFVYSTPDRIDLVNPVTGALQVTKHNLGDPLSDWLSHGAPLGSGCGNTFICVRELDDVAIWQSEGEQWPEWKLELPVGNVESIYTTAYCDGSFYVMGTCSPSMLAHCRCYA